MAEPPAKLVVRTYAPVRRLILGFAAALLGCFALYVAYELGRYDGGYDRLAAAQQRVELEVAIQNLEKQNRELRTQLAELDTVRVGQERERAEISRTIGELQAQVARQAQELAFYRGIVQQGAAALGVRIHELRISATEDPQRFELHLTLVRSVRPDDTVSGTIGLRVDGETDGRAHSLDLATLTGGEQSELPFTFRYFENFEQEIVIPGNFKAERVTIEIRSNRKGVAPFVQSFLWKVDAL
ncbi:MAG: hypothetical protein DIU56_011525 [Pseudomonadota bacterium]|jgi:hypothetical protein|nr:MAG: hypothetical protein DIU56_11625 [Pseudomonadota bacterium]